MSASISFCTVSMNRLHHLMRTLPANISDNLDYENLVHIVLDYNSTDGTEYWIKSNLEHYILSGRLIYYRNPEPERFNMAHSKNMVIRLSTSDLVCLIDADNFTGRGYAKYAADIFSNTPSSFITTISSKYNINPVDVLGRVCFKRKDFEIIEGFDEFMNNYGYDDFDFCNRLQRTGLKRIVLKEKKHLQAIKHTNEDRIRNQKVDIKSIYVANIDPSKSQFLYLFGNRLASLGAIIESDYLDTSKRIALKSKLPLSEPFKLETSWKIGNWNISGETVIAKIGKSRIEFSAAALSFDHDNRFFHKVSNMEHINWLIYIYSVLENLKKTKRNYRKGINAPNNGRFGKGIVYKNNDPKKIILQ